MTTNIRTRLGGAYRMRARQAEKVRQYIDAQETKGAIICGDFNDTPISYAYHQMKKGLKDAYVSTSFGRASLPRRSVFVFGSIIPSQQKYESVRSKVDRLKFSDHYPAQDELVWDQDIKIRISIKKVTPPESLLAFCGCTRQSRSYLKAFQKKIGTVDSQHRVHSKQYDVQK